MVILTLLQKSSSGEGWWDENQTGPSNYYYVQVYGDNSPNVSGTWLWGNYNNDVVTDAQVTQGTNLSTIQFNTDPGLAPGSWTTTPTVNWYGKKVQSDFGPSTLFTVLLNTSIANPSAVGRSLEVYNSDESLIYTEATKDFDDKTSGYSYNFTLGTSQVPCFDIHTIIPEKNILDEFCRVVKFKNSGKGLYTIPKDTFGINIPDRDLRITAGHPFILNPVEGEIFVENLLDRYPQIIKPTIQNGFDEYLCTVVTNTRTVCKIHNMDIITFSEEEFEQYKNNNKLIVFSNL